MDGWLDGRICNNFSCERLNTYLYILVEIVKILNSVSGRAGLLQKFWQNFSLVVKQISPPYDRNTLEPFGSYSPTSPKVENI